MTVAYPDGGRSYERDGKRYYPGAGLMLADRYEAGMKLSAAALRGTSAGQQPPAGWWASEKMDGLRVLWNGEALVTRSSPGKDPKAFCSAPAWFLAWLPPGFALDGELWMGKQRFHDVAGISNAREADDARWRGVRYVVFDAPAAPGPLEARLEAARLALKTTLKPTKATLKPKPQGASPVSVVFSTRVRDDEHLAALMRDALAGGGEGLILRAPGSAYVPKRSKLMLKLKGSQDAEAVVTGRELATAGKYKGLLGALVADELDDAGQRVPGVARGAGRETRVGTGFSDDERREHARLFPNGTVISIAFFERTPGGAMRMPSFRGVREDVQVATTDRVKR
jgi:DNA ligase-1